MERTPSFQVQQFGAYYLLDRLAVGGMAEIFKAKQLGARGFEKIVVIKKILQHLSEDPEFVAMFEDEAKIAAQLNHANIVQIYELGEIAETLYITMEYVEGRNLRDLTRAISGRGLHLSLAQCVYIMGEVLKGLDFAHRKKDSAGNELEIVHRDMSPQNIIVSYEGEVKILDFGIAKASSKISKTEAGVLKGKFSYMSPEQASGQPIDQTTDIYACGVIFHELLTSQRLFKADSDIETLDRVRMGIVPPPSEKNPRVPKELDQMVLKALKKSPEKRYQTAGEFLRDLNQFAFSQAKAYDPQELSAFMQTLFEDSIQLERDKLQAALEKVSNAPIQNLDPARTHIAFKSSNFPSVDLASTKEEEPVAKVEKATYPTKTKRSNKNIRLGFVVLFFAALIGYLWMNQSIKNLEPPASKTSSTPIVEPPETESQKTETQPPTEEPTAQPPIEEDETEPPSESKTEPVEEEKPSPKIESVFKDVFVPPAEQIPETSRPQRLPPTKELQRARVRVIAPESGYAELFVENRSRGYIPNQEVANFELTAGRFYEFKCVTETRTYAGRVRIQMGRLNLIDCQKLQP